MEKRETVPIAESKKRKRSTPRRDNNKSLLEPAKKHRKTMPSSDSEKTKPSASRRDNNKSLLEPAREKRETVAIAESKRRKPRACLKDNNKSLLEPAREETETTPSAVSKKRKPSASRRDNDKSLLEPARKKRKTMPRPNVNPNGAGVYPGPSDGAHGVDSDDSSAQHDGKYDNANVGDEVQICRKIVFPWYIFEELGTLASCALYLWMSWISINEYIIRNRSME
jgi:hypothetical protein